MMIVWLKLRELGRVPPLTTATRLFAILGPDQRLLISEDVALLQSAFKAQQELNSLTAAHSCQASLLNPIIICSIVYTLILFTLLLIAYVFDFSMFIIIFFLLCLFALLTTVVYSIYFYPKYWCNKLTKSFENLTIQIQREKEAYKQLAELIEDHGVPLVSSENHRERLQTLSRTFRDIALQCFFELRHSTLALISRIPLKADIDQNLICTQLPEESFDSYQNDDELNTKAIKSLRQLVRLQVSEFLKCSLLLFVENYYRDRMLFDQNILTYLTTVLVECSRKSIERVSEIESNLAFHRSLYSTHHVTSEFSTPSEVSTLWATCRTVRKGLYSSLVLMDEIESLLKDNCDASPEMKQEICFKLDQLATENNVIRETVINVQKSIKLSDVTLATNEQRELQPTNVNDSEQTKPKSLICEENVTKDEVFVGYTDEPAKQLLDIDCDNDPTPDTKNLQEAGRSVFCELRSALKPKAIEHKIREGKALGVEVNVEEAEREYLATLKVSPKRESTPTEPNKDDSLIPRPSLNFNFNLAMQQSASQMRLQFNLQEDKFGDDSENEQDTESE